MDAFWESWPRWLRRLSFAVLTAIVVAFFLDLYARLKTVVSRLAAGSSVVAAVSDGVILEVRPVLRSTVFHGFLWIFGHYDYSVTYQASLSNLSEPGGKRVPVQVTSAY